MLCRVPSYLRPGLPSPTTSFTTEFALPEERVFASRLNQLDFVRRFVWQHIEQAGLKITSSRGVLLDLALNEAAANVVKHAYAGAADASFTVAVSCEAHRVRIDFCDQGQPFDPEDVPPPAFDGSRCGGFGVYLIRQTMQDVCYTREDGTNRLSMTFVAD